MAKMDGSKLLVKCLEAEGVRIIFGIPGAKIDAVFNALVDSKIKLVVCRHEQNAAFMAGIYGRITGKPGVVLVTSGPGVGNLATGLLTATTEGDPIVAIGGNVPRNMSLKHTHQGTNNVKLMEAVTKTHVEITTPEVIPEVVANAFRQATLPKCGACFISLPQDIGKEVVNLSPITKVSSQQFGRALQENLVMACNLLDNAKMPLLFLGMEASRPENTKAIRELIAKTHISVVMTYQAAGAISKELLAEFDGRVGLFRNQPGDRLISLADLIITIGFDAVEYDPEVWNIKNKKKIISIDYNLTDLHNQYHPILELTGDIATNIRELTAIVRTRDCKIADKKAKSAHEAIIKTINSGKNKKNSPIHPLRFIYELQKVVDDNTRICCDIGTVYMWMSRYFLSHKPHQLLFSNGQQTLGVALPWAIANKLYDNSQKVISISGDGGFLFSAMELETAVREGLNFVHFIWRDGAYNMVLEQELMKYKRKSGVDFGKIDIPAFAKAFGAIGYELNRPEDFSRIFTKAINADKPVLIDVPIDYSDNPKLFEVIDPEKGH